MNTNSKGDLQIPNLPVPDNMNLTLAEAVFAHAHDIHTPHMARQYCQRVVQSKTRVGTETVFPLIVDKEHNWLAGICQKILLNPNRFKQLYASAYTQGLFKPETSTPWRRDPYGA